MCCGKRVPRRWLWLDNRSFSNRCWPRCRPYKVPQLCTHPTGYLSRGVRQWLGEVGIFGAKPKGPHLQTLYGRTRGHEIRRYTFIFPLLKSYNFYTGPLGKYMCNTHTRKHVKHTHAMHTQVLPRFLNRNRAEAKFKSKFYSRRTWEMYKEKTSTETQI